MTPINLRVAIDPIALLGSPVLFEIRHPHVPTVAELQEALRHMTPNQQQEALKKARALTDFGKAVEEAFAAMK